MLPRKTHSSAHSSWIPISPPRTSTCLSWRPIWDGPKTAWRACSAGRVAAGPNQILAALVHACRYCGLLDASVAAHDLAIRLDPAIETSVLYTVLRTRTL